ncbi:UPF0175 family protein [Phormidium sp. CCY1219]|uniref:UPF0175 family protein n=1 Tax=Phormidium sp. CCY1219 TaxID=2886104 RepID=UPI002D1EE8AC|nr:UPF0175 family protein [Phormidium sp. CCY1219]MEB3830404.1 UPF0175 family protein [Phormidium sp. CCY1219]
MAEGRFDIIQQRLREQRRDALLREVARSPSLSPRDNPPPPPAGYTMSVIIPGDILTAAQMSAGQLTLEIAIMLLERDTISIGKARNFAGMH